MKKYLDQLSKNPIGIAVGVVIIGAGIYWLGKKTIGAAVDVGAGVITGNNPVTQNQSNAAGEHTSAYEGAGVLGTLGAATNSASGGVLASVGETIGGWAFDLFGPKVK